MGLSRNKVAVSEGAAGSPPFYGDHEILSRGSRSQMDEISFKRSEYGTFVVQFSGIRKILEKATRKRGCSSAGRAPALQAGGHGFEPHHLHQSAVPTPNKGSMMDGSEPMSETVCSSGG